jgi:hypothetical protein
MELRGQVRLMQNPAGENVNKLQESKKAAGKARWR